MGWVEKGKPTPFDTTPIDRLYFLDGDAVPHILMDSRYEGKKCPVIAFPSGEKCELREHSETHAPLVNVIGDLHLPLFDTYDEAYKRTHTRAEELGYIARQKGDKGIEIYENYAEGVWVTYDDSEKRIANVTPLLITNPRDYAQMELLTEEVRSRLPHLYANEQLGMNALAQVKFFTPDSNWTWYASEGSAVDEDGYYDTDKEKVDFVFFGMVDGYEIELGYFSLSELTTARGPLGLPIERDRHFTPKTLGELKAMHEQARKP